jgi:hypothetical protein
MFSTKFVLKTNYSLVGLLCLYLVACTPEDDKPSDAADVSKGVYVINEGEVDGSLSIFNRDKATVQNGAFEAANGGLILGSSFQSMNFANKLAYFIAQKSNKITIAEAKTLKSVKTISGLEQPRNILFVGDRGFITQWGNDGLTGTIQIIDTTFSTILKNLPTGKGADKIALIDGLLWVLNSGGLGKDSTITQYFIDQKKDSLVRTMNVHLNPNSIVRDGNGETWVLCGSYADRSEGGKLVKIKNSKIELSFDVPKLSKRLVTDKAGLNLYFIAEGKVWVKDLLNFGKAAPSVFGGIKKTFQNLSAFGVDTETENFYCADAFDNKTNGSIYVFDKTTYVLKDSAKVGVKPTGFIFK